MTPDEIEILVAHLEPASYTAGSALCRAGDPADRLWILTRGTVSVRIAGSHANRRLASLGPGCSVGEMGMLEKQPRSADVYADDEVHAYVLTDRAFETILRDHPRIGQAILVNISRQLAHRLRVTSEDLRLADE
jgi:SulP family sulfate permease